MRTCSSMTKCSKTLVPTGHYIEHSSKLHQHHHHHSTTSTSNHQHHHSTTTTTSTDSSSTYHSAVAPLPSIKLSTVDQLKRINWVKPNIGWRTEASHSLVLGSGVRDRKITQAFTTCTYRQASATHPCAEKVHPWVVMIHSMSCTTTREAGIPFKYAYI